VTSGLLSAVVRVIAALTASWVLRVQRLGSSAMDVRVPGHEGTRHEPPARPSRSSPPRRGPSWRPTPNAHPPRSSSGARATTTWPVRGGRAPEKRPGQLAEAKAWLGTLGPTPASTGSPGPPSSAAGACPRAYERAYRSSSPATQVPQPGLLRHRLGMVAPTILAHGTSPRPTPTCYLRKMYRGDLVGCQLFSEPGAGIGPGRPHHQGGARRRRVGRHRPEGLDLGRPLLRHRRGHLSHRPRPAQAQGPHRLRGRHARARRGGPAAAPDDRRRRVQRGVLRRGPAGARLTTASAT
jgi:hypothetical protein